MQAIAQEYQKEILFRIHPKYGTRETAMPKGRIRQQIPAVRRITRPSIPAQASLATGNRIAASSLGQFARSEPELPARSRIEGCPAPASSRHNEPNRLPWKIILRVRRCPLVHRLGDHALRRIHMPSLCSVWEPFGNRKSLRAKINSAFCWPNKCIL